jgi:hypothetical protein
MSKLFASIESDKGGRITGKGGDSVLEITIMRGNTEHATIYTRHDTKTGETITVLYTELFGKRYEKGRIISFENVTSDNDKRNAH